MNRFNWHRYLSSPVQLAIFSCLLTIILSANFLSSGVGTTPDGWGYWEGSVSLLNGDGYIYFGGQPITVFGPLFSLYLAAVQKMAGVSGWSLALGLLVLAGLTSGAWSYLFCSLSNREAPWAYPRLLLPVYVSMFVSYYFRQLFSETLFLLLLALLFVVLVQMALQKKQNRAFARQVFTLNLLLMLLLFTRNAAWVFVPGVVATLWLGANHLSWVKRVLLSIGTTLFALISWTTMRQYLGQGGSHPLTWVGNYRPSEYIDHITDGLATILGPQTYGIGWVVLFLVGAAVLWLSFIMASHLREGKNEQAGGKINPQQAVLVRLFAITVSGFAGLYALFNLMYVHDQLTGRFLWFLVLGIIGVWAAYTTWLPTSRSKRFLSAILIMVMLLQIMRTSLNAVRRAMTHPLPEAEVALHHTIRSDYFVGGPIQVGGPVQDGNLTVVAPPDYEWLDRQYSKK